MQIGIVTDPGFCSSIGSRVAESLRTDQQSDVSVSLRTGQLPPTSDGKPPLDDWRKDLGDECDLVVAVTELPLHIGPKPVMAQVSDGIVAVFVPTLGVTRARSRAVAVTRSAISREREFRPEGPLRGSRWVNVDENRYLMAGGLLGRSRLLAGMIRANRPWRLVPTLSGALAAASAASAFGVFYSSIWRMAADMAAWRLTLVSAVAIAAMAVWLILPNGLWEGKQFRYGRSERWLYNVTTLGTVLAGTLCMYLVLMTAVLAVAAVVISPAFLSYEIGGESSIGTYLKLGWLTASLGTVAGAVGSSGANNAEIRRATYGRRELERRRDAEGRSR